MKLGNAKELILLDEGQQIHNHDDELETGSLGVHVTVSTDVAHSAPSIYFLNISAVAASLAAASLVATTAVYDATAFVM